MLSVTSACSSIGTKFSGVSRGLAAIAAIFVLAGAAHAAAPLAGTSIGNQASASYLDQAGVTQNVTSNIVTTIVQPVAALTLTSDLSKTVTAGSQVSYPHTLTNTGNGTDTYTLAQANSGAFVFTSVLFYADANGDGVADNTTPISQTTALAPGAVFRFVVVGNVPTTAVPTAPPSNTLLVTATSLFNGTVQAFVTDRTTVTANAVINVNKSMNAISGAAGSGPYTVTLNYSNTGNTAASAVTLGDILPAGMTYVAGSGLWSVTGATALSDGAALDGTAPTIDYQVATGSNVVTALISTVAAGQSGTVTFKVSIASVVGITTVPFPAGPLNNTATYAYNDGVAAIAAVNTNTFVFTVNQTAAVASNSTAAAPIIVASVAPAGKVAFNTTV